MSDHENELPVEESYVGDSNPFIPLYTDEFTQVSAMRVGNGVIIKSRTVDYEGGLTINVTESMTYVPGARVKDMVDEDTGVRYCKII